VSIRLGSILFLALCLVGGWAQPAAGQSSPVYNPLNGHWYQAVRIVGGVTWPAARAAAAVLPFGAYTGHLATLTAAAEQQFVVSQLPLADQGWWIGAYQETAAPDYREPREGWRWVTGEPWSFTAWIGNQPDNYQGNEHAAHLDGRYGSQWNDLAALTPIGGYIVEYEPLAAPGAVGVAQLLLYPASVVGGQSATGQVMLSQLAGPGGVVVPLFSSNPAAAVVPATVTVPGGATGTTFPIITFPVAAPTPVVFGAADPGGPVTATLQVQPNSSPSNNLLVNGSFEEPVVASGLDTTLGPGGLPGWRILRATINVNASPLWQPAPGAGNQSLDLVGSPGASAIEQTFATVPGQEYLFSGWISHNADNPVAPEGRANVFLNGQFFVQLFHRDPQTTHRDMRWVPFAFRFLATAPATTLRLDDVTNVWDAGGGLFLDGLAVTPEGPPPPPPADPPVYNPANGHWYQAMRLPVRTTWPEALIAAERLTWQGLKGHLATITSPEEDRFINTSVLRRGGNDVWWLGGYQDKSALNFREPDGAWRWITGEPLRYSR
jgi:hypothetical protein